MNHPAKSNGLTLVELMVTIAIMLILSMISAPSYSNYLVHSKVEKAAHLLAAELNRARAFAMKSQRAIILCRSSDQVSCDDASSDAQDWSAGWISFVEVDNQSPINRDQNREELMSILTANELFGVKIIHANATKRLRSFSNFGSTANGHYLLCTKTLDGIVASKVILIGTGRARIENKVSVHEC